MKRSSSILILFLWMSFQMSGQSNSNRFSSLSSPEKWWIVWHPFKAKKALEASLMALEITDSIKKEGIIGMDINGGKLDAFKHCFWMAALSHDIGRSAALKLGRAHEKGNYRSFLKGNAEDGVLPDKVSSEMDLFNNEVGIRLSADSVTLTKEELIHRTLEKLRKGGLRIIKKEGDTFLTCEGNPIPTEALIGNWENEKCLVPSNDS